MSDVAGHTLGDLADVQTGPFGSQLHSSDYVDEGTPIITVEHLAADSRISHDRIPRVNESDTVRLARYSLQLGDLVFSRVGAIDRCSYVSPREDGWLFSGRLLRVRPNPSLVNPRFLTALLSHESSRRWIKSHAVGSTMPCLNTSILEHVPIRLPQLSEQRRIADILDTVDEAVWSTERLISKLDQVKQGLLHDLLTRGVDSNGRLRADYTREPGLYRSTRLGPIPMEWTVHLLDDVSVRGSGHTPNKDIAAYWNGGIKWVSLADSARLDRIYITETDKEISDLGIANSSAVRHRAGTVILSRDAGVGKSAILAQEMAVSQHFMAWTCGEALDNHYLYYWLQFMKPRFEAIAMGSTIKTIGLPFFRRLSIPLPRIDQQKAAAAQLLAADADIVRHQVEVRKQQLLKQGLMDDLLTGRVQVGAST
jgi:type I restriction enzyme, S subunit